VAVHLGATMQPEDAQNPAPAPAESAKGPGVWRRIQTWDSRLSIAKGLTAVTLLTSLLGGYFQYLSSYQDKVSEQAKVDMADATGTFVDISNAFAEALMLQQLIYFDYLDALHDPSDAGGNAMIMAAAQGVFPDYIKARTALRQNSNVFARKAEIYIDWASDLGRDPATSDALDQDPLTETLLGNYNFNCSATVNFPHYGTANADAQGGAPPNICSTGTENDLKKSTVSLCAIDQATGKTNPAKPAITIDWHSAKHHLLTMHYCFEIVHGEIETARIWASKNDVSDRRKTEFLARQDKYRSDLNRQVARLNAFMSLAMSQLERIRVKYRPSGFFCHVPLVRDAIGLFSDRCTPIRTAQG
jgi:hypothetical protein